MPLETSVGDTTPLTFDSPGLWTDTPAQDAPPVSEPSADATTTASSPEAAQEPSVETTPADAKPRDLRGPIPYERHEAVLNTERKRREEVEAKWKRVEWASALADAGHTAEQVQRALAISGGLTGNTVGFIEQLLREAAGEPTLSAQVRSIAARVLGSGQQPAVTTTATDDAEPQPDFYTQNEDGTKTPFYSGPQQQKWQAWQRRQMTSEIDQRLAPLEKVRQDIETQRTNAEQQARYTAELDQHTKAGQARIDELKKESYFTPEFFKAMQDYAKSVNFRIGDRAMTIDDAWLHVLRTTVPTLARTEQAKTIADLRTRATSSSVTPRTAVSGVPAGPKGFFDPSLEW